MTGHRHKLTDLIVSQTTDRNKLAMELYTGETLTYGELIQIMQQTQAALERFNVKPYARVALVSNHALTYLPVMLGIMETAAYVTWDFHLSIEQHVEYLELIGIDYLISNQAVGAVIDAAKSKDIGIIQYQVLPGNTIDYKLVAEPRQAPDRTNRSDEIAIIFTTSGTTSKFKLVPMIYDEYLEGQRLRAKHDDLDETSIQLIAVQLDRTISLVKALNSIVTNGRIVYTDGVYPQRIIAAMQSHRITHFFLQPAGMLSLMEYIEKNTLEYPHEHKINIISLGSPLPLRLKTDIERYFHAKVVDDYGMTEIGMIASTYKAPKGYKPGSVGCCPPYLKLRILDGEVLVKGTGLFCGYENDPEANKDSFIDGWFRTGDAGYLDEDGYLFLTGRFKELINRGGEKISPFEVEKAIMSLGNIRNVTVFPYSNSKGEENIGAVIVSDLKPSINLLEIRAALKDKVKPYKLPTILYVVDEIPISSNNKVQRNLLYGQLRGMGLVPELLQSSSTAEEYELTPTERIIMQLWKTILEQDFISLDDDFFVLGGDSLKIARVYSELEKILGIQVPISVLFHTATISELAAYIDSREMTKSDFKFLVPIRETGHESPLFCIHALDGEATTYHSLGDFIEEDRPVYGVRFVLEGTEWQHPLTIDQLGEAYAREIETLDPYGPYNLCGTCIGGVLSFAVAQVLIRNGKEVAMLAMLDSVFPKGMMGKQKLLPLFINSIDEMKGYGMKRLMPMTLKKIRSLAKVLLRPGLTKRYLTDADTTMRSSTKSIPRDIMLSYAYSNYKPAFLNGTVYFFRALQDWVKQADPQQWGNLSEKFCLIDMPCRHNDINSLENSKFLMEKFSAILKRTSAPIK